MGFKPTKEQLKAINTKGNILVAAAAGSGKTAVLVERVINKLTDKISPVNADRLLIVTFTNAAAAEMRTRIEKRLDEECRNNPFDVGLLKQKQLLRSAKICTIDSFCIDLVRENFEKAGVTPDFKMSDGYSLKSVDESVLSGIINRYFVKQDKDFMELLDIIGAEYDETDFIEYILDIYYYSRQLPYPETWFESLSDEYDENDFNKDNKWYDYCFKKASLVIDGMSDFVSQTVDLISYDEKTADRLLPSFLLISEYAEQLLCASKGKDWDEFYNLLNNIQIQALPNMRGLTGCQSAQIAKLAYDNIKKDIEGLKALFYSDLDTIISQLRMLNNPVKLLSNILKEFDEKLFAEYLEQNTFTFHNTEHLALKLLEENPDEFLNRYEEVMVDEYQDTNDLQDMLFYVLSSKEKKLFVVGDVKQSIYGFRGANPKNFLYKKNKYVPIEMANDEDPKKIILGNNFRCKPEVCNYINFFFQNLMTDETGSIIYNSEEMLIPSAVYPKAEVPPVEIKIADNVKNTEDGIKAQACIISEYIENTLSAGKCIRKSDTELREAKLSDFTILLRSVKTKAPLLASELRKYGIPVNYNSEGYSESIEIKTAISLLKVLDNPDSDIDLLTLMMSPIFGFTADMMANIRIENNHGSLYGAVVCCAENGNNQCINMLQSLRKFRLLSSTLTLPELISRILNETGYIDTVSMMKDGIRRRNNLLLLYDYAKKYYKDYNGSLGSFVKYIIKQSDNGIISAAVSSGNDTVKIMSIHASKGLQFPICIIAGTESEFNDGDSKESTIYSTDYGIGFKYFDEELKKRRTTIGREVIIDSSRLRSKEEELRLLYVAMTRTQDRLVLVGAVKNADKLIKETRNLLMAGNGIRKNVFLRTKSYLKWIIMTSILHPDGSELRTGEGIIPIESLSHFKLSISEVDTSNQNGQDKQKNNLQVDNNLVNKIKNNINYVYPYERLTDIESKCSVTQIANKAESLKFAFSAKPSFMSGGGISAQERGTAMHKVMELFNFEKYDQIEEEISRLYEWQFITEREAESINRKELQAFFKTSLFKRIKNSQLVKREMRFITEMPVREIDPTVDISFENEKIIIQGAVDLCFVDNDKLVIVDFKTDRVDNSDDLINAYKEQLSIYATACQKIFAKNVYQKIIYSFSMGREINL